MQQQSYRIDRINTLIRRELTILFKNETKDPRLQTVVITDVLTSRDMGAAKIFYTVPESDKMAIQPLLDKAAGFFRSRLSKIIDLRYTPTLRFVFDPAPNTGARIDALLSKL